MSELFHIRMRFGNLDKIETEHRYTLEQATEIQQIVARATDIALKHRVEFIPLPPIDVAGSPVQVRQT